MQFKNLRTTAALAFGVGMAALALTGCNVDGKVSTASGSSAQTAPGSSAQTAPATNGTHDGKAAAARTDRG
ncbi:hypothetical protein [Actinoallomurus sp. NPDC052274]|uniref:hypothetical protein n=1 Tax=Actinoallomurus sp. NPDC052274 TaxID=3155420 RepID=UPI0034430C59